MVSVKEKVDRETFLSLERSMLAEERTLLAYIRTELTFLGVVIVLLKLYFDVYQWDAYLALAIFVLIGIIVFLETTKIKKLRNKRKVLQEKYIRLKKFD